MSNRYTDDQQKAIDSIGCDTLVSAAAGSGKTAVLVERILNLISRGDSIENMLVVTFTNAAAAEMKERIKKALQEKYQKAIIDKNYDALSYYLKEIRNLQSASISTLHSFCIEVIKKYSYTIDLADMRIGDEAELKEITEKCTKDLFLEKYEKQDEEFESTLNTLANGRDKRLYEIIMELNSFSKSIEDPHKWLLDIVSRYEDEDIENSIYYLQLSKSFDNDIERAVTLEEKAYSLAELHDAKVETVFKNEIENIKKAKELNGETKKSYIINFSYATLRFSKDIDPNIKTQIKQLRDDAKKIINKLKSSIFCLPTSELLRRQKALLPIIKELIEITIEFDDRFLKEKQSRALMDFSDLEHYALSILKNSDVCAYYKNKYKHIFIDEYQDTNAVQEAIISSIKRDDNLFMVGDVKQSIYRFRQADPTLFIKKYELFGSNTKNEEGLAIDLRANFRSASNIINAVNAVFEKNMSKELGEINYDDRAKLTPGFDVKNKATTSVYLMDSKVYDDQTETFSSAQKEALCIADIIKGYVGQKYYDFKSKTEKEITYGDIAILLRSAKGYIGPLSNSLAKLGIPCYEDISSLEYSAQEVTLMLSMLKIIDNIKEDTSLLGVMQSIIGSFSIDELVQIREEHDEGLYYDALLEYSDKDNDLGKKAKEFLIMVENYSALKNALPISELLERIMSDTGYYMYAGALPSGNARQINLDGLLYKARAFESNVGGNLYEFISYIERTLDKKDSTDAAGITREQNLVRLMTVHKSKGLEFPVVIIAGAGRNIKKGSRNDYGIHRSLGLGMKYIDREQHIKAGSLSYAAIKDINDQEGMSEELRIMYVALTRAIAHISIVGQVKDIDRNLSKWQFFEPVNAGNWLDWIMPAALDNPELFSIEKIENDNADMLISNVITKEDLLKAKEKIMNEKAPMYTEAVKKRLGFTYISEGGLAAKTSVTAVTKQSNKEQLSLNVPEFIEHEENKGAFKGTATHELLSHIDLNAKNINQIREQIDMLMDKRILTELEAEFIDMDKVKKFLNSSIADRMRAAKELRREQPFTIKKNLEQGESIIQGIIDCCFVENDNWVLLDFKTDSVYEKQKILDRAEYYRDQLELYKEALEKTTGMDVKDSYIYFLSVGELVEI